MYRNAHFHFIEELTTLLQQSDFQNLQYWQTLANVKETDIEKPKKIHT